MVMHHITALKAEGKHDGPSTAFQVKTRSNLSAARQVVKRDLLGIKGCAASLRALERFAVRLRVSSKKPYGCFARDNGAAVRRRRLARSPSPSADIIEGLHRAACGRGCDRVLGNRLVDNDGRSTGGWFLLIVKALEMVGVAEAVFERGVMRPSRA